MNTKNDDINSNEELRKDLDELQNSIKKTGLFQLMEIKVQLN